MSGGTGLSGAVAAFVALLAGGALVGIAAERLRIPAAVALVAVGLVAGARGAHPPFAFGPALLSVFLPPLIFEAGWNLDLATLRRVAGPAALLAVPGTLLTFGAVAFAAHAAGPLDEGAALVLAAALCATDPVAVVAVFRRLGGVPAELRAIVEAESIANDGVAVVLFGAALAIAGGVRPAPLALLGQGLYEIAVGVLIGALAALVVGLVLARTENVDAEVLATIVLAYGAYLAAEAAHASGILACAAAAIVLRARAVRTATLTGGDVVDAAWSAAAAVTNAVVFLATGMLISLGRIGHEPRLVATVIFTVLAVRVALAVAGARGRRGRFTLWIAGMRGALPLALVLTLPADLPGRGAMIDATFAVVLVTLVLNGLPLEGLMRRAYSESGGPASSS